MKKNLIIITFLMTFLGVKAQDVFNMVMNDIVSSYTYSICMLEDTIFISGNSSVNGNYGFFVARLNLHGELFEPTNYIAYQDSSITFSFFNSMKSIDDTTILMCGVVSPFLPIQKLGHFLYSNKPLFDGELIKFDRTDTVGYFAQNFIKTKSGSLYIIGQADLNHHFTDYDNLNADNILIKLNEDYETEWDVVFGAPGYERVANGFEAEDGNIVLSGRSSSFSSGLYPEDWYIVKTDSLGNFIWERSFGHPTLNDAMIRSSCYTSDSAYVFVSSKTVCEYSVHANLKDAYMLKLDTAGNTVWDKQVRTYSSRYGEGEMFDSWFSSVIETSDGNLAAIYNDQDTFLLDRTRIMIFDQAGNILRSRQYYAHSTEIENHELGASLIEMPDKGFLMGGYGDNFNFCGYDASQLPWLVRTDSLGVDGLSYTEAPPTSLSLLDLPDTLCYDESYPLRLQCEGLSAPYHISFSTGQKIDSLYYPPVYIPYHWGTGIINIYDGDDFIISANHDRATLFTAEPTRDIIEIPWELEIPEGYGSSLLTATLTDGYGIEYEFTFPYVVKDCLVDKPDEYAGEFSIYPNPAKDILNISCPSVSYDQQATIQNSAGQPVKQFIIPAGTKQWRVNLGDIPAGNYFLLINQQEFGFVKL